MIVIRVQLAALSESAALPQTGKRDRYRFGRTFWTTETADATQITRRLSAF